MQVDPMILISIYRISGNNSKPHRDTKAHTHRHIPNGPKGLNKNTDYASLDISHWASFDPKDKDRLRLRNMHTHTHTQNRKIEKKMN